jgi:hypothetical protein
MTASFDLHRRNGTVESRVHVVERCPDAPGVCEAVAAFSTSPLAGTWIARQRSPSDYRITPLVINCFDDDDDRTRGYRDASECEHLA